MIGFLASLTGGVPHEILTLESGPLRLRPPQAADYPSWAELRQASRPFLQPWEPAWPADDLTQAAFRRRLARYRQEIRSDSAYPFFLVDRHSEAILGGITLANVRRRAAQSATLGYWMGAPHAGKGHMTEAVKALTRHAFLRLGLERIEAACLPDNAASVRVLEKAGFRREGYARGYLSIAGARRDHVLFARLKSDPIPE
ncbi:MAG: GNAT family protein [Beijerinckiaceae bacterium]|nr:GNAT family protein [Beijerinckiaceae bacterium]